MRALTTCIRLHDMRKPLDEHAKSLPLKIFVLIAAELDARMLGRLGCAAQRFSRPTRDPTR